MTQTKEIQVTKFNDVKSRVDYMRGYAQVIRQMAEKNNVPVEFDEVSAERSIRKSVARHNGTDNKYDRKGNLRELPYERYTKNTYGSTKVTFESLFGEH